MQIANGITVIATVKFSVFVGCVQGLARTLWRSRLTHERVQFQTGSYVYLRRHSCKNRARGALRRRVYALRQSRHRTHRSRATQFCQLSRGSFAASVWETLGTYLSSTLCTRGMVYFGTRCYICCVWRSRSVCVCRGIHIRRHVRPRSHLTSSFDCFDLYLYALPTYSLDRAFQPIANA